VKIERLELRLVKLPLVHFFETSFGRIDDKHFILVRADGEGATGYGECVAEQDPYYSSETNETAWHIIAGFVAPRVLGAEFAHPRELFPALKAIRGHNMAKAAVEMAAWDLFAKQRGEPLSRVLGGTRDRIASGVSIGIQPSLDALEAKVKHELAAGYRRIKIKVKPGWDVAPVEMISVSAVYCVPLSALIANGRRDRSTLVTVSWTNLVPTCAAWACICSISQGPWMTSAKPG